jgi:hypothetical protein
VSFRLPAAWQIGWTGLSPAGNICYTPRGAPETQRRKKKRTKMKTMKEDEEKEI